MGPLARWRRTCLFDVTCEHARKSVWSSICYIPLWSDNIKRFSQLGVPSELSSWFGWILGFLLHSRLDFVSVLQLISSNALIWTRPDHFGGVGWNRFLAVLSIWFHMLWTTSILSRPVGLSRRERQGRHTITTGSFLQFFPSLPTLLCLACYLDCLACASLWLPGLYLARTWELGFPRFQPVRTAHPPHPTRFHLASRKNFVQFKSGIRHGQTWPQNLPKEQCCKNKRFLYWFLQFFAFFFGKFLLI